MPYFHFNLQLGYFSTQFTIKARIEIPKIEPHIEVQWVPVSQLDSIDLRPEPLKQLISRWLNIDAQQVFQSELE